MDRSNTKQDGTERKLTERNVMDERRMRRAHYIFFMAFALAALWAPASAFAEPAIIDPSFDEVGDDVIASWNIRDLAFNTVNDLPLDFVVTLCEDDMIYDDRLGQTNVTVPTASPGGGPHETVALGGGGYRSPRYTHTFRGASNAATGWGDDYYLTLDASDCPYKAAAPEDP